MIEFTNATGFGPAIHFNAQGYVGYIEKQGQFFRPSTWPRPGTEPLKRGWRRWVGPFEISLERG